MDKIINLGSCVSNTFNYPNQDTEVTSTPTRPVENVVITTKGLQDRNNLLLDGRTMENKGKLVLNVFLTSKFRLLQIKNIVASTKIGFHKNLVP